MKSHFSTLTALIGMLAAGSAALAQTPLGSEFTYQGKLDLQGSPLSGTADFEFTLWDAEVGANMIDAVVPVSNVTVIDGQFTVEIDFGVIAFNGDKRWLEIAVASPSGAAFTTLRPRQPLTAAPYALQTRGIFVTAGGNVGIGTTTPEAKLGVAGEIRVQSKITSSQGDLTLSGGGWGVRIDLDEDGGSSDAFRILDTGVERFRVEGDTGNVGIGETNPSAALDVVGTTELNGDVTINSNLTVDTDTLFVDGTADKVGIGTATPGVMLDIDGGDLRLDRAGATNVTRAITLRGAKQGSVFPFAQINFSNFDANGGQADQVVARIESHNNDLADSGDLRFYTIDDFTTVGGALERMRISETGNVGIGTTNPSALLHVAGTTRLNGHVSIGGNISLSGGNISLNGGWLSGDGANEGVFVANNGRVGIGTTRPSAKLDVNGNVDVDGDIRFGPALEFHVPADTDRTVIVRGKINGSDGSIDTSLSTTDVTSSQLGEGHYSVTFPSPFSEVPIVTVTPFQSGGGNVRNVILENVTTAAFELFIRNLENNRRNGNFNFIAIGER